MVRRNKIIPRRAGKVRGRRLRRYQRRRARRGYKVSVGRQGLMVKDEQIMKFRYTDNIQLQSTSGVPQFYQFAGNSLFDPDITGTGHQPYGFDQWSAFYNKYTVFGCKAEFTVVNASGNTAGNQNDEIVVCPVPSDVAVTTITSMTDLEAFYEFPYSTQRVGNIVGGGKNLYIKKYMSTSKIDGCPKLKVAIDDKYSALTSANPSSIWKWVIGLQCPDELTTTTVRVLVKLTFYCKMFDRIQMGQS